MAALYPDKFSYTLILSSPAHFVAEIEAENFFLTHAWPTFGYGVRDFDPGSRSSRHFFALTFGERRLTAEEERNRNPPHYGFVGDYFSVFLSLYFGKLFESHGFLLDHGFYCLPNIEQARPRKFHGAMPFASRPRKDLGIRLRFDEAATLVPILDHVFAEVNGSGSLPPALNLALAAGRFYQQALQLFDPDPELAFLSLVNAGEVLVSGLEFTEEELQDEELSAVLAEINERLEPETAEEIRMKLFGQISRRFRKGLSKQLNEAFYSGSETPEEFLRLTPGNIEKHMRAAYNLRSKFLHAGTRFGSWVLPVSEGAEIATGTPAYGDKEWKKLISEIPTLAGLERVIRYSLLRFVHTKASPLHPSLD